jgi:hypothetical protein
LFHIFNCSIIWVKFAGTLWIIGGEIRQLINILFCGYQRRSEIWHLTSDINHACRNLYASGAQVPQRVTSINSCW